MIRSCYNQRSINPAYQRLTFAFFGVAIPSDLISNIQTTSFNIGQSIQLEGFKEHEAQPLLQGLTEKVSNPQTLLKEILAWTGGQPFLTVRLLELYRQILSEEEGLAEKELILSGLVVKQQGSLKIHNRIYQSIFNRSWLERSSLGVE